MPVLRPPTRAPGIQVCVISLKCTALLFSGVGHSPIALKHGITGESIAHAVTFALYADDDFQGTEPPKVLVLGPDPAGNILEVVGRLEPEDAFTIFHAMVARPTLLRLLQ